MEDPVSEIPMTNPPIALLGFGEAAQAFVQGWKTAGLDAFRAFDIKTDQPDPVRTDKMQDYQSHHVEPADDVAALADDVAGMFSLVTADQAAAAAQSVAKHIRPGTFYFDCNSCSPQTKQASSELIAETGARYVDVAIMAPVHPKLHRTALLISGPHATDAAGVLGEFQMEAEVVGDAIGAASGIKLSRSIIIKGMEALLAECALTARSLGVEDPVFASLERSNGGYPWRKQAAYALERMAVHGERRAAEMEEAAKMVAGLAVPAEMSRATAQWQKRVADLKIDCTSEQLTEQADRLIERLKSKA